MSYMVCLHEDSINGPEILPPQETVYGGMEPNITYNLAEMFEALPCDRPVKWQGKLVMEVIDDVRRSYKALCLHPNHYKKYEAKNGFGTIQGARGFLGTCLMWFNLWPEAYIEVC